MLIDSGVIGNFTNKEFTRRINYKKKTLKKLYDLLIFDGTPSTYNNNKVIHYSKKVKLQMNGFKK